MLLEIRHLYESCGKDPFPGGGINCAVSRAFAYAAVLPPPPPLQRVTVSFSLIISSHSVSFSAVCFISSPCHSFLPSAVRAEVHQGGPQRRFGCLDSTPAGALQLGEDEHVARYQSFSSSFVLCTTRIPVRVFSSKVRRILTKLLQVFS